VHYAVLIWIHKA